MTYTVSHRQAGAKRSAVGGLIRHEFRDIDKHNGVETRHSNERIVPERTHLNESRLWIDGEEVELTDSRQIVDELDRRLSKAGGTRTNKKTGKVTRTAVRKDAGVVRDIVLQLDPHFTRSSEWLTGEDGAEHLAEIRRLHDVMIEHYAELYGRENLLAASLHLDETSPHVHLLVTPIDDQGRVRQESFLNGKKAMKENDRAMRARLAAADYNVDPEPRGLGRAHMSVDEYAQWQQRIDELEAREVEVADREATLNKRSAVQKRNREWLDKQKKAHDAREARLSAREVEVEKKAAKAEKVRQSGAQALAEARELREKAVEEGRAARAARDAYGEGLQRVKAMEDAQRELLGAMKESREKFVETPRLKAATKRKSSAVTQYRDWEQQRPDDELELG